MKLQIFAMFVAVSGVLVGATQASAHAVAIGFTPGASAGEVNLWLGSYHNNGIGDGNDLEGSARLIGQAPVVYDVTKAFTYATPPTGGTGYYSGPASPVPAGLTEGSNLIYLAGYGASDVRSWEAVTFSGLSVGTYAYTYVPDANATAHWQSLGLQGIQLTLTQGDVGGGGGNVGVPEPASLAMWGLGAIGMTFARRRCNRRNSTIAS